MDALIDQALETVLHSAIWRSMWHMQLSTLIIIAAVAFLVLAYRRTRKKDSSRKSRYRDRSKYRK
jgi:cytochrome bd-type quinol oxidase subunit 1